jgi:hypothetical protein
MYFMHAKNGCVTIIIDERNYSTSSIISKYCIIARVTKIIMSNRSYTQFCIEILQIIMYKEIIILLHNISIVKIVSYCSIIYIILQYDTMHCDQSYIVDHHFAINYGTCINPQRVSVIRGVQTKVSFLEQIFLPEGTGINGNRKISKILLIYSPNLFKQN